MENEVLTSHRTITYQNQEVKQSLYDGLPEEREESKNRFLRSLKNVRRTPLPVAERVSDAGRLGC